MEDRQIISRHIESIRRAAKGIKRNITIMEICGGHTNIILKYGIRQKLPDNIRLVSGPGCPVCVSSQHDIDCMIEIAEKGVPVATYGDMLRVPGSRQSLDDIRAKSGRVFDVYSATEVLELRKRHPDIVFFGIGFETTAPMTAFLLKNDVCVYSVHKLVPPAMEMLSKDSSSIDGFIDPGHVSTIIGADAYRKIRMPQAIAGFTLERVLRAISILLELIRDKKAIVVNAYPEAVNNQGNADAQRMLKKYFYTAESEWRGLGIVPVSGLEVKDKKLNAKLKYRRLLTKVAAPKKTACRCGEILMGLIEPDACPLYKKSCTPESPQGACMVSSEGSCAIHYSFQKSF